MKRSAMLMAVLAAGAVAVGQAHAHPPMGGPGAQCHGPGGFPFTQGVDLTAKQKDSIKQIFKSDHDASKALHKQDHDLHEQVEAVMMAPGKIDQAKLDDLVKQQNDLDARENAARMAVAVKGRDLLTPEQLSAAKARQDKVKGLMEQIHQIQHGPEDE